MKMIKVTGVVTLRGDYIVELDMTEEEFDSLSKRQQDEEIESAIDWRNLVENSETDDIDVYDLEEIEEEN
jgi:formylmethanofuran dehydrogenase subunit E